MNAYVDCWVCDGFGFLDEFDNGTPDETAFICYECHGTGEVEDDEPSEDGDKYDSDPDAPEPDDAHDNDYSPEGDR